jgi:hypothetical protein
MQELVPYRARVDRRAFLNYPGFHGGAYVYAYVEDTSERALEAAAWDANQLVNPQPRVILEIADCARRIELEFEAGSAARQANSLHKVDTLIEALVAFRAGLAEEFALYEEREADRQRRQDAAQANGSGAVVDTAPRRLRLRIRG